MTNLRAIDGSKKVKALAEAEIKQCPCGSRTFVRTETGVLIDKRGKEVFSGTKGRMCARCGKVLE